MVDEATTESVSGLTKALLIVLGLTLALVGLGVVTLDPNQVRTSPLVLFATGVLFAMLGVLAFAQPHQGRYPSAYRFLVALLVSSGAGRAGHLLLT
jgi:hypothetical protein